MPTDIARCAQLGTVTATVASASYANAMVELAGTARAAGFPCLVVQPFAEFNELHASSLIEALPLPERPLLPRQIWCVKTSAWYGWRRSHFYRVRMWVAVIASGFHLLAVDCDWRFFPDGPFPLPELYALLDIPGRPLDVINWWDGPHMKQINVGLMWLRSTPATLSLVRRVHNRTMAGWEQALFNEDLQFRSFDVSCCHCNTLLNSWFNRSWADHRKKTHDVGERLKREGAVRCAAEDDLLPPAEAPPNTTKFVWNNHTSQVWHTTGAYNYLAGVHYGRCTGITDCTCRHMVPDPRNQSGTLALQRLKPDFTTMNAFQTRISGAAVAEREARRRGVGADG